LLETVSVVVRGVKGPGLGVLVNPPLILSMIGNVNVLLVRVLVDEMLGITTPSTANTPAALLESVVSLASPSSIEPTPSAVDVDAVRPLIGRPVQFVKVPDVGVPSRGVTKVGEVANTLEPVPVSSVNNAAKFALDGVAKNVAAPVPSPETPVEIGNPVQFVKVPDEGVPNTGVVSIGDVSVLLVSV